MYIDIKGIHKSFGATKVLHGVDLQLQQGEHCVVRGASGSGKSTLLYILGGMDTPDQGRVIIEGVNLVGLSDEKLAQFRNQHVGFIFQFHFLLPSMTCLENALLPARIGGENLRDTRKRVEQMFEMLGISHCAKKYPFQLSGGEQQRVNIIRALSLGPRLLLCDEPTGNLDSVNSQKVLELILGLSREFKTTLMLVTHDERIASFFDKKITIEDGRIIG